ncbi:PPPDE putative peptidase domain-containing protein [Halteromyces radiatus]|uniref:PPPDE putative peptidase domain-containing protein n=1 Tax=Halteromyces radiatus TaxID=101107 RepID=UPI00221F8C1D|nr:PPPDE putative peptidase domain-containing protein [Halteromyces radiatus]KAI8097287.1 PPPDE putative peptidase domain-containing protein [Halteromyces radiatus]
MSGEPVKLYVYDLSQGMAKQMSLSLTGKQIDGIWHTSIVVYGQEFYFGQGILVDKPGTTHHGQPLDIIDMGTTFLPLEVFTEYIDSQRSVYTAEKYHLLDFNCNTFSNDVCQFLTGSSIPSHITELPAEFLRTPFGQSLLPMIENMFGKSTLRSTTMPSTSNGSTSATTPNAQSLSMLQDVSSSAFSGAPSSVAQQSIQQANNLSSLQQAIKSYTAVAVFFTSATCPPCRVIKPEFEQMIKDKNQGTASLHVLGIIVDTSIAFDAGAKYQIRSTPTFMFFHKGEKISEFSGANYSELKSSVELLLFTAYPPHPHRTLHLRQVCKPSNQPILYNNFGKLDMILEKLHTYLKEDGIHLDEHQLATLNFAKDVLLKKQEEILDMEQWQRLLDTLIDKLPMAHQFPLLDIARSLILTKEAGNYYTTNCHKIAHLMDTVQNDNETDGSGTPKATWLMILRLACNLFTHQVLVTTYFTSHLASSHRSSLTQLLVSTLLAQDAQVRQAAASLAFNCSTVVMAERLRKEENSDSFTGSAGMAEQEDDDWQVEIMSAVMDALTKETDQEITHRLLACISKFLFLSPQGSSLGDLLSALDIRGLLDEKKTNSIITSTPVLELARDIKLMVDKSVDQ